MILENKQYFKHISFKCNSKYLMLTIYKVQNYKKIPFYITTKYFYMYI